MPASMPETAPTSMATTDDLVVEAPTAEQALAEVTSRLGPRASIVEAGKVMRGGLGGFFARELVQLRARPSADPATDAATAVDPAGDPSRTTTAGDDTALQRLLAGITDDVDSAERSFADVLRGQLGVPAPQEEEEEAAPRTSIRPPDGPVIRSGERLLPAAEPALTPAPARAVPGTPEWSVENLQRLGLPAVLVDAARDLDPLDDGAWVHRLGATVARLCRPLPEGPMVLAGPHAPRLADSLGLPVVAPGDTAPATGSFAARIRDTAAGRAWLAKRRGPRWLHVVVGGTGWRGLLFDDAAAVSWTGKDTLPAALQVAVELDLPLGYAPPAGRTPRPANPVDVAIAVRDLLPRR